MKNIDVKFYCAGCKKTFITSGNKKEWTDPIYGPCVKYITNCPDCGIECNEYREPAQQKKSAATPEMTCGQQCSHCEFAN